MNLIETYEKFPTQQDCIVHLEQIRWPVEALCPLCESDRVRRKADKIRVGRWNCHECKSSFNVLSGTVFSGTHVPLQKWFLALSLMINAKKSLSSHQLGRDLKLNHKTAWFMQQRIRAAMTSDEGKMLQGIIEMDETYVGGKPRYKHPGNKRGRGTRKSSVVGAVERGGKVKAQVTNDTKGRTLLGFIKESVEVAKSALVTDDYLAYRNAGRLIPHSVIDHRSGYVNPFDRSIHTNTIEGFWALIKRAWYGTHHHYSRRWMPLFVGEACWKYNHRHTADGGFDAFFRNCFR